MSAHHYAGTLDTTDPGLRLAIGLPGAGKTYGTRAQVYDAIRRSAVVVLAIDPTHEWSSVPADLSRVTAGAHDLATVQRHAGRGARLIVLRTTEEPAALLNEACAWARRHAARVRHNRGNWPAQRSDDGREALTAIVAPEAHRSAPLRSQLLEHVSAVATAWRHERVAMWLDTQRLALVSPTLRDLARETRFYAAGGRADLAALAELDAELPDAVRECARRFVAGEPGWHVRISTVAIPPFVPTRDLL